jgi:hypothetical protein
LRYEGRTEMERINLLAFPILIPAVLLTAQGI